jgi:hypothetical protein
LKNSRHATGEAAFAALDEFSGDNQTDDATILAALVH